MKEFLHQLRLVTALLLLVCLSLLIVVAFVGLSVGAGAMFVVTQILSPK